VSSETSVGQRLFYSARNKYSNIPASAAPRGPQVTEVRAGRGGQM